MSLLVLWSLWGGMALWIVVRALGGQFKFDVSKLSSLKLILMAWHVKCKEGEKLIFLLVTFGPFPLASMSDMIGLKVPFSW